MSLKRISLMIVLSLSCIGMLQARDCKNEPKLLALRDTMSNAFNMGDSARFFTAVTRL